jgi:hypothetical protein
MGRGRSERPLRVGSGPRRDANKRSRDRERRRNLAIVAFNLGGGLARPSPRPPVASPRRGRGLVREVRCGSTAALVAPPQEDPWKTFRERRSKTQTQPSPLVQVSSLAGRPPLGAPRTTSAGGARLKCRLRPALLRPASVRRSLATPRRPWSPAPPRSHQRASSSRSVSCSSPPGGSTSASFAQGRPPLAAHRGDPVGPSLGALPSASASPSRNSAR